MIVCPRCGTALRGTADTELSCAACPYRADRREGVLLFSPGIISDHADYRAEGLDGLYRHERDHPWFRHRLNVVRRAFAVHVGKAEKVLEVGAGTGYTARVLKDDGYADVSVGEMHVNGLVYAKRYGLDGLYQFDLRTPPFRDHFDAVALFDVLEHLPDDAAALRNIHGMLRSGGKILLTTPAHRWLWSRVDDLSGHHRRYDRGRMASLLKAAGFAVLECRYFFIGLVPGLLVRSLLARTTTRESLEHGCGLTVSGLGHAMLRLACGPGDVVLFPLRHLTGGSLIAVARKP
jgi:2-polyprenyl-3-methyl-5-hydroxy-6-metoxy-1,4-benzoquinol methylase